MGTATESMSKPKPRFLPQSNLPKHSSKTQNESIFLDRFLKYVSTSRIFNKYDIKIGKEVWIQNHGIADISIKFVNKRNPIQRLISGIFEYANSKYRKLTQRTFNSNQSFN